MTRPPTLLDSLLTGAVPLSLRSHMARAERGTYPTSLDVEDDYPSDERVEEIRMVSALDARRWLHDEFPRMWGEIFYGHVETEDVVDDVLDEPALRIYVATGGWSGCEDVIDAVLSHFMMAYYCRERLSGGGYTFLVPHEDPG